MDDQLRKQLVAYIKGGQAFDTFDEITGAFKPEHVGVVPKGIERSAWQIVEHMRLSLRDILDYSQNEKGTYEEKEWPEGYWPQVAAPASGEAWQGSVDEFRKDREELIGLAQSGELFKPFSWAPEHNLLREILLAVEHSAYHCGQLILVQELLNPSTK